MVYRRTGGEKVMCIECLDKKENEKKTKGTNKVSYRY